MTTKVKTNLKPSPFKRVLPESMRVGNDRLELRLDFYKEAIVMKAFDKQGEGTVKMVSAFDIVQTLASSIPFNSGLLPENALWWSSSNGGTTTALWVPAGMRRLALQGEGLKVDRFNVPMPGLIFLCQAGKAPYVYAMTKRPAGPKDRVYRAPLANVYYDGGTCPGNHKYPAIVGDIPDSFFKAFFSAGANLTERSKRYPDDIIKMWRFLDVQKATEYPLTDLVYQSDLGHLMESAR